MLKTFLLALPWFFSLATLPANAAETTLRVGSKRFTESYILGEIIRQSAAATTPTEHLQGMGNTAILFEALKAGSIDVYPEYLGTIDREILKNPSPGTLEQINRALAPMGLGAAVRLGFNNTYALAMRAAPSLPSKQKPAPATLSALEKFPQLRLGLSHEFIGRADGWPGLAARYGLPQTPRGLDHGIAYEALNANQVDVIDIYSTDAKIGRLGLQVLDDDRHYFPRYDAVLLYRLDVVQRFGAAWKAIESLQGRIDESAMIAMNGAAELDGKSFAAIAHDFLATTMKQPARGSDGAGNQRTTMAGSASDAGANADTGADSGAVADTHAGDGTVAATSAAAGTGTAALPPTPRHAHLFEKIFDDTLWRLTREHLTLVLVSVLVAALAGIPLGVAAAARPLPRQLVLAGVGMLQTIPSLALLAMLIPLLGRIGTLPALIALCLYALLPIVRNTCTGLQQVSPGLRQAALALGLTPWQRLLLIDLPLAMPVILAGLKTAAVMSVGTATIAAFIGAGGFGERIAIGLALNDNTMLLAGAIPAAALAFIMQGLFEWFEWWRYGPRLR
ncbi:MAG: glycine betaine ABC transporter substrate-binding protein, partial [Janthinobacterium lividum]